MRRGVARQARSRRKAPQSILHQPPAFERMLPCLHYLAALNVQERQIDMPIRREEVSLNMLGVRLRCCIEMAQRFFGIIVHPAGSQAFENQDVRRRCPGLRALSLWSSGPRLRISCVASNAPKRACSSEFSTSGSQRMKEGIVSTSPMALAYSPRRM